MCKVYVLILVLFVFNGVLAQNKPVKPLSPLNVSIKDIATLSSCWGIPFGQTKDSVVRIIMQKTRQLPLPDSAMDTLIYKKVYFNEFIAMKVELVFYKNHFYGGNITFKPPRPQKLYYHFLEISEYVMRRNFNFYATKYIQIYKNQHKVEHDYRKISKAILDGELTVGYVWEFNKDEISEGEGCITLSCNEDGTIKFDI